MRYDAKLVLDLHLVHRHPEAKIGSNDTIR